MKSAKIISAIVSSVLLCSIGSSFFCNAATIEQEYKTTKTYADSSAETEKLIYRKSVSGKCEGIESESNKWDFLYALTAYDNGHIHIDVQCESSFLGYHCNKIGDIQLNDSMIAALGEKGFAGESEFNNYNKSHSKYNTSFSGDDIVYTAVYSDSNSSLAGETLMSFDFYVKEQYLKTNQKINFFGTEIEIPFGEPPIDKDEKISELEKENLGLKEEIDKLKNDPSALQDDIIRLDANGDGFVNAVDASAILIIYAYNSTHETPITTLSEYNSIVQSK